MTNDLFYRQLQPDTSFDDFIDSFWMLENRSDQPREVIVLPDGRIDLVLSQSENEPFNAILLGLGTSPSPGLLDARMRMFAISFKPLAMEYILHQPVNDLVDSARSLPSDVWEFTVDDLTDFDRFVVKATRKIQERIPSELDNRKRSLFNLIYTSQGTMSVQELSESVFWSSRQINRYFNQHYGVSLKTYCNVLRFRTCFSQIKEGKLFPEQAFADQAHFIKEIRKHSGTVPKELFRNKNDRFIQFSALSPD